MDEIISRLPELFESLIQTLIMMGLSGAAAIICGLAVGIFFTVISEDGLRPHPILYSIIGGLNDLLRSLPFVILVALLVPVTRSVMGTAIGIKGALFPLAVGTVPFFARLSEAALKQCGKPVVEAAKAAGCSDIRIIFGVYLRESLAELINAVNVTFVSLLGLTAMAGAVGGGGIGDFAVRYGHQRNRPAIIWAAVAVLIITVLLIKLLCDGLIRLLCPGRRK